MNDNCAQSEDRCYSTATLYEGPSFEVAPNVGQGCSLYRPYHNACVARQWRPMLTLEQMVTDGEPWDDISDPTCTVVDGAPWSDICEDN